MDDDVAPAPEISAHRSGSGDAPVQHCPWCGEHVGSFWGRREAEGAHWCESCQRFFRVEEA